MSTELGTRCTYRRNKGGQNKRKATGKTWDGKFWTSLEECIVLLVGFQAVFGGFQTPHCRVLSYPPSRGARFRLLDSRRLPAVFLKACPGPQNFYLLKHLRVSRSGHTPTHGECIHWHNLSGGWGNHLAGSFQGLTTMPSLAPIILLGRIYAKEKIRLCIKIWAMSIYTYVIKSSKRPKQPRTANQLRKLCYIGTMRYCSAIKTEPDKYALAQKDVHDMRSIL